MKSVGKKSRHIRITHLFITERLKDKELKVIYCPTKETVAVFFTKPLQGLLFITYRDIILCITQEDKSSIGNNTMHMLQHMIVSIQHNIHVLC